MTPLKIPVGISDFKKLRENGYYYIDKSGLIADLLTNNSEVTLITRPRRFGKTLAMSMLANFFDIRKKSQNLFTGLQIESRPDLCQAWMRMKTGHSLSDSQILLLYSWLSRIMARW